MIFLTSPAQAEEFFRRCMEQKAETLEERLAVMEQMVKERRCFVQNEEQIKKRIKGKRVLRINAKPTE